jgi:preprotein translocase subunit SecE
VGAFFYELLHVGLYKRSQGRITRQVTFAGVAVTLAFGFLRLSTMLSGTRPEVRFALPAILLLASLWATYRLVNVPAFADFLISVEAEMNKVSWPTRSELFRASLVVLILIFALAIILSGFDYFWKVLFVKVLHIL